MTLRTASRTAVVSAPTSTRVIQKPFPSEAAVSAISVATLTAFWIFSSPIFFFAFFSLSWFITYHN